MCRRVSLRSFKYFLFSSVIVTALLIYIFCYKLVSYTADSTLAKDSNTSDKASSWQNDRLGESISTQPEQATNSSAMALLSGRGLVIKNSSKGDIKNTIGGSSKQTLKPHWTITNSSSSYKRSGTYTHVAMDSANGKLDPSVYGELGCPKNPKRKDFYELLQHWIQICKQNNIEYVLAYGSLLGAMRDADVIPYDSDVDVQVDHNYFLILKRLSVKRDFNPSDEKLRLVVQPEFALNISMDDRRRFNCEGKVGISLVASTTLTLSTRVLFREILI